ncbi:MAG: hypothetical protein H6734_10140 [Alphaproteobacteria bacterium]|nr:hypothetical protein [Alphaproteobacteria bacterium]
MLLALAAVAADPSIVQGVTVSTPTYGQEWGSDAMASTLDELVSDGVNWVSYHPYARVYRDGRVEARLDVQAPPDWIVRPIREAHARGVKVMVKPHLAYWGSGFGWRGDITFDDPVARERFFREYTAWIEAVARVTRDADAFVVGTELDATLADEAAWREVIRRVRAVHGGHLTYAANWDGFDRVPFWDALDAVGVQAYFPLVGSSGSPTEADVHAGWDRVLPRLHRVSAQTGKPVVFTELGYDEGPQAAREPWASGRGAPELQRMLLRVALERVAADPVVRGVFLWKWFPGELPHGDFQVSRPDLRAVLRRAWR